jgi:hypothetical protein
MNARASFGLVAAAAALTLAGCSGGGDSATPAASAPPPAAASTAPAASAASTTAAEFGVPECDDYFKKYLACIDSKVPEAARAQVRQSLDQTKAAWKQAASTPDAKAALATGCKQATETAKTAMAPYGCSW